MCAPPNSFHLLFSFLTDSLSTGLSVLTCLWIVAISYWKYDLCSDIHLAVPIAWGYALFRSPALVVKRKNETKWGRKWRQLSIWWANGLPALLLAQTYVLFRVCAFGLMPGSYQTLWLAGHYFRELPFPQKPWVPSCSTGTHAHWMTPSIPRSLTVSRVPCRIWAS